MTGRKVKLVLDGKVGDVSPIDTGIPHGSPVAPILFVTYLSASLTRWREQYRMSRAYHLQTTLDGG